MKVSPATHAGRAAHARRDMENTSPYPKEAERVKKALKRKSKKERTPAEQLVLTRRAQERVVAEEGAMVFDLPWPPTSNNLFRNTASGRILTVKAKRYRSDAGHMMNLQQVVAFPVKPPIALRVFAHPPADNRRRDLDNLLKAPIDAMQSMGLFVDDADIDYVLIQRDIKSPHGLLRIRLWTLDR